MFKLIRNYKPSGDQPEGIKELVEGSKSITHGTRETTLNNNKNIEYSLHIRLNKSNDKLLNFFMKNSINKGVINL